MTRRRNRRSLDRQSKMMSGFIAARREIDRRSAAELGFQAVVHRDVKPDNTPADRDLELQQWRATWGVA